MIAGVHYRMRRGESETRDHPEDRIVAVVRGRVRIELAGHQPGEKPADKAGAERAPIVLRSSDALAIPAGARYTVHALQDTELFLYTDRGAVAPALWGV